MTIDEKVTKATEAHASTALAMAEATVRELTAKAMAAPELVAARQERDRMAGRVKQYRDDRARLEAEADDLSEKAKAAVRSGDDAGADAVEKHLSATRAKLATVEARLPDLEGALAELVKLAEDEEAKAVRLAARAALVDAQAGLQLATESREAAEKEAVEKLSAASKLELEAEYMRRALRREAAPSAHYLTRSGEDREFVDSHASEAVAAGLPVLTD